MDRTRRPQNSHRRNPLIASLLGSFRRSGRNERESAEESLRYPPELMRGFALGALLGVLPVAALLWLIRQDVADGLVRAASQPGSLTFWLFWISAGLLTALLITGAFVLMAIFPAREAVSAPWPALQVIPATGENEKDEEEDEQGD